MPLHPSIIYPKAIVASEGILEGRIGYILPVYPMNMRRLDVLAKSDVTFASRQAEINAMIELCEMLDSLHDAGYYLNHIVPANILVATETGKCCLINIDYITQSKLSS